MCKWVIYTHTHIYIVYAIFSTYTYKWNNTMHKMVLAMYIIIFTILLYFICKWLYKMSIRKMKSLLMYARYINFISFGAKLNTLLIMEIGVMLYTSLDSATAGIACALLSLSVHLYIHKIYFYNTSLYNLL